MNKTLSPELLQSLKDFLLEKTGLFFPENSDKELVKKVSVASESFGFKNLTSFVTWVRESNLDNKQLAELASHLTIGETYFMREKKAFDFLEQIYLPGLIRKRSGADKSLHIWCAGCATGEEAYSIAIVLLQTIPLINTWDITILATDINPRFLEKARKGIYTKWSFRNNSEEFLGKYFIKKGVNEFHILPEIKKMVKFSFHNLVDDTYPSPSASHIPDSFDIIFCRNVLIYFKSDTHEKISSRFYNSLIKGGILILSPVETSGWISKEFSRINFLGYSVFQKEMHKPDLHGIQTKMLQRNFRSIKIQEGNKSVSVSESDNQADLKRLKLLLPKKKLLPKLNPAVTESEFDKALKLYKDGKFDDAEAILEVFLNSPGTDYNRAILLMAKTKANSGKLREAEELCIKGIGLDKLNPSFYYLHATIMQEQGTYDKAIESLRSAIYIEKDFVLAHFLLGSLYMKSGETAAGKKSFRNALSSLLKFSPEELLPESDGLTAGRFREIINSISA